MSEQHGTEAGGPSAAPASPLDRVPPRLRGLVRFLDRLGYELIIVLLVALVCLIAFFGSIVHNIPAGHVGVLWSRFGGGTRLDTVAGEGIVLTLPWDRVYIYDRRLQQDKASFDVLMQDGLSVHLEIAWRYRVLARAAPLLHQYVGEKYRDVLVGADILQRTRDVLSVHASGDLYSARRLRIQSEIRNAVAWNLRNEFNPPEYPGIDAIALEDVMIRDVSLPPAVQQAIIHKNQALQRSQEYNYRIESERKEAERRRIEALGIRNFQEIVNSNLSEGYLRWRGIEATLELAKSPNSKVIVVGSGRDGLPLILNPDGAPGTRPAR